ncbi:hypothetical protein AAII07_24170 [Microvirga sp. 0TCS3.31]
MSKQVDWTIKGFIIGALIDYALRVVFRLIFGILRLSLRFWCVVFPLIGYLYVHHKIAYWWNNEAERDAIYASFQSDRISLINPRAIMTTGGIRFIEFDVVNGANARIYKVSAICTYEPEELRDEEYRIDRMYTEHAYAEHIAPGETKQVKLPLVPNGYLWQATSEHLVNLKCEPGFEYERDDLFQGETRKWRLSSQVNADISYELTSASRYGESVYLNLTGTLRNNSAEAIRRITVLCETTNLFGVTETHGKHLDDLELRPGAVLPLKGRVTKLSSEPTAALCRLERVEKV